MSSDQSTRRRRRPLSQSQQLEVRTALAAGGRSQRQIADAFDLSPMTVSRIAKRMGAPGGKTTGGMTVSARVAPDELEAFDDAWRRQGAAKSRGEALRRLVRQAGQVLDADPETLTEWREIARQLRGVATNINQMAYRANRGELVWRDDERAEIEALGKGVGALSRKFTNAISVASRKSKSVQLLGERGGE